MNKPLFGKTLSQLKSEMNKATVTRQLQDIPWDIHIFDGGGGYYHTEQMPKVFAEGATVKIGNAWYCQMRGNLTPINYCDIPDDAKATMLLLGLQL